MTIFPKNMLIMGCGNMGGAILSGWLNAGLEPASVHVVDPFAKGLPADVKHSAEIPKNSGEPDFLLLAVKPQMLDEVAASLGAVVGANTIVVSILAGVECNELRKRMPEAGAIVRLMPNMAVTIGKSAMALFGEALPGSVREQLHGMMETLGPVEWLEREELMHLVTALSGSGPAYVFRMIDALGVAAGRLGMEEAQARRFALAMVEGAAMLAAASDETPGALAERVASPGGTTRKGMDILDADERLISMMQETLKAAADRSAEMAAEAKGD